MLYTIHKFTWVDLGIYAFSSDNFRVTRSGDKSCGIARSNHPLSWKPIGGNQAGQCACCSQFVVQRHQVMNHTPYQLADRRTQTINELSVQGSKTVDEYQAKLREVEQKYTVSCSTWTCWSAWVSMICCAISQETVQALTADLESASVSVYEITHLL